MTRITFVCLGLACAASSFCFGCLNTSTPIYGNETTDGESQLYSSINCTETISESTTMDPIYIAETKSADEDTLLDSNQAIIEDLSTEAYEIELQPNAELIEILQAPIHPPKAIGTHTDVPRFGWVLKSPKMSISTQDVVRAINLEIMLNANITDVPPEYINKAHREAWRRSCQKVIINYLGREYTKENGDQANLLDAPHVKEHISKQTDDIFRSIMSKITPEELMRYQFTTLTLKKAIYAHIEHGIMWQQILYPNINAHLTQAKINEQFRKYAQENCVPAYVKITLITFKPTEAAVTHYSDNKQAFVDDINELANNINPYETTFIPHNNLLECSSTKIDFQYLKSLRNDIKEKIESFIQQNPSFKENGVCSPIFDLLSSEATIVIIHEYNPSNYPSLEDPKIYQKVYEELFQNLLQEESNALEIALLSKVSKDLIKITWPGTDL